MSLNLLVEVGVSAIIQKMILVGVDKFTMQQLVGISLILVSLGVILWVDLHPTYRTLGLLCHPATKVRDLARERTRGKFARSAKPPVMRVTILGSPLTKQSGPLPYRTKVLAIGLLDQDAPPTSPLGGSSMIRLRDRRHRPRDAASGNRRRQRAPPRPQGWLPKPGHRGQRSPQPA